MILFLNFFFSLGFSAFLLKFELLELGFIHFSVICIILLGLIHAHVYPHSEIHVLLLSFMQIFKKFLSPNAFMHSFDFIPSTNAFNPDDDC